MFKKSSPILFSSSGMAIWHGPMGAAAAEESRAKREKQKRRRRKEGERPSVFFISFFLSEIFNLDMSRNARFARINCAGSIEMEGRSSYKGISTSTRGESAIGAENLRLVRRFN